MSIAQEKSERLEPPSNGRGEASEAYVWQKARALAVRDVAIAVSHHCAACVLDETGRILTFTENFPLIVEQGFIQKIDLERRKPKLLLKRTEDQKAFISLMQPIFDREKVSEGHLFIADNWVWRVVAQELDPIDQSTPMHMRTNRQFIVRFINLALKTPVRPYLSLLQDVFALTPAEVNLCAELLQSKTLPQASERLGIKVSTARTQLKSIFEKVGVNSQSALIARLTALIIRFECASSA